MNKRKSLLKKVIIAIAIIAIIAFVIFVVIPWLLNILGKFVGWAILMIIVIVFFCSI